MSASLCLHCNDLLHFRPPTPMTQDDYPDDEFNCQLNFEEDDMSNNPL